MRHARFVLFISVLLLAGLVHASSVSLIWTNPTLNADGTPLTDLDHMNLYRCLGVTCEPLYQRSVGLVSSVIDSGLAPDTAYVYQVTAVDTGGLESTRSNVALATTAADPAPSSGLVAAYGLNEGGGLAVGDALGGPTGLISGAVWTSSGRYGKALNFDGVNDRVTIQSAPSLQAPSTAITLTAWIRPNGTSQPWASILQKVHGGNYLSYAVAQMGDQSRRLVGYVQVNGRVYATPATSALPNQAWSAVVLRWASGQPLTLRISRENGTLFQQVQTAQAISGTITYDVRALLMGEDEAGNNWKGRIDEVRLYNRVLSLSELQMVLSTPVP